MSDQPLEREFEIYASIAFIEEFLYRSEGNEVADLSTTVRTVSTGIDALKKLGELALKTQNIELQEGILELRGKLLEVKESLLDVREENLELREKNKKLSEELEQLRKSEASEITLKNDLYYKKDGDGPFCTNCFDSTAKLVRVPGPLIPGIEVRTCPSCKTKFGKI